jgi:hypothetical protein
LTFRVAWAAQPGDPDEQSALRLIRALAVEIHKDWIEAHRYLNMEMLRQQTKQLQFLEAP